MGKAPCRRGTLEKDFKRIEVLPAEDPTDKLNKGSEARTLGVCHGRRSKAYVTGRWLK